MSRAEVERFVDDLAKDDSLLEKVKPNATGLASVVAIGKNHGYNFTLDEAKSYIQSRSPQELTDKQLDAIVGGKHHHSSVATSTKVVQTAAVATTAVEAAEVATTVAEAAEAVVVVAAVLI
ncbi:MULTISPECIES: Nif11-like leader peptide family natural product precursor [Mesorhizobium]|uniref:Nif11-like leader peptide domain-containing protein n=1 Tax=Mesorhizobium qingshengii TaxID=1165689 RepID=A0A1G5ZX60_9HYPH|nr:MULTISPECIES: Nif11-like leader peptide family natural product precursor [Mesorhizobium]MCH4561415.1 Nif11-like leader peptide family natural product precursor [Mesorhizobium jarvisii]QGU21046.1 Nif11-like leader peptide family natural product precursor [Mesorhizobium huakuii 7653R]QGU21147.1 Nif11-like leader peptide family natural product precursor [Mesorhizobium huakuii 7653R]SDA99374.1 nif11-like leader peptide domain-containing protein [Mesorhizobium qingshengii]